MEHKARGKRDQKAPWWDTCVLFWPWASHLQACKWSCSSHVPCDRSFESCLFQEAGLNTSCVSLQDGPEGTSASCSALLSSEALWVFYCAEFCVWPDSWNSCVVRDWCDASISKWALKVSISSFSLNSAADMEQCCSTSYEQTTWFKTTELQKEMKLPTSMQSVRSNHWAWVLTCDTLTPTQCCSSVQIQFFALYWGFYLQVQKQGVWVAGVKASFPDVPLWFVAFSRAGLKKVAHLHSCDSQQCYSASASRLGRQLELIWRCLWGTIASVKSFLAVKRAETFSSSLLNSLFNLNSLLEWQGIKTSGKVMPYIKHLCIAEVWQC